MHVGLVTIGQGPREDLVDPFRKRLGEGHEMTLVGALDGLTGEEVQALGPQNDEEPLVTRLCNGASVTIARERVTALVQTRVDELQEAGASIIVVLCTGPFPSLGAAVPLILPDSVLRHFVLGVLPYGAPGIVVPLAEQADMMREKWSDWPDSSFAVMHPYAEPDLENSDGRLFDAPLLILDCMGYSSSTAKQLREVVGKPVVAAQDVLAHAVELLVAG